MLIFSLLFRSSPFAAANSRSTPKFRHSLGGWQAFLTILCGPSLRGLVLARGDVFLRLVSSGRVART